MSALPRSPAAIRPSQVNAITWPSAWTPASVLPAASTRTRLSTGERCERGFELSLDRPGSRLELVARKVRAVIFDPGAIAHGRALSGAVAGRPALCCVGASARSLTHRSALAHVLRAALQLIRRAADFCVAVAGRPAHRCVVRRWRS